MTAPPHSTAAEPDRCSQSFARTAQAEANDWLYLDFAQGIAEHELLERARSRSTRYLRQAQFPSEKHLEAFDYDHQATITKLRSPNYDHQTTITKLRSPNYDHQTTITKLRSPNYDHQTSGERAA